MSLTPQGTGQEAGGAGATASVGGDVGLDVIGELERIRLNLQAIAEVLRQLQATYNGHMHVENTAAAYTQNAATAGPSSTSATEYTPV